MNHRKSAFRLFRAALSSIATILFAYPGMPAAAEDLSIRIAAAANLSGVAAAVADGFARSRPEIGVEFSYGSSGALAAQIRGGAPYDLFLSADLAQADALASMGLGADGAAGARIYAVGVLCVASRHGVDPGGGLAFLASPIYRSVALARPELAPYGAAAVAALEKTGLAELLRPRLVYGTSIGQTARFVATGAADAGFVNLSAAIADPAFASIPWVKVDPALYAPIEQAGLVLRPKGAAAEARLAAARDFFAYMLGPSGRAAFLAAGYGPPPLAAGGP